MTLGPEQPSSPAEVQREQLHALYHPAREIAELRDLRLVLDIALYHCLELTGSQFGFIGLNTADREAMDVVAIRGFEASPHGYARFHLILPCPGIVARVVLENRPVRGDDATTDPVCGINVAITLDTHSFTYQLKLYHFCCPGCRVRFMRNPQRYLAVSETSKSS